MIEGEAVRPSVIKRVWLCPVHAEEFWVPHGGICPSPGCDRELRVYWALDEVLDTIHGGGEASTEFGKTCVEIRRALERRFSGEGA